MKFQEDQPAVVVRLLTQAIDRAACTFHRIGRGIRATARVARFGTHGANFRFDPDGVYTYSSIHVGDNVDLGYRPILIATRSRIQIGSNVMFGPEVTIRGGNHRIDLPEIAMTSVSDDMKLPEHDRGVVIEDDVWIGTRAIILHGVTIGKGSVIGAGSVVTHTVPPYSVAAGNPARVLKERFSGRSGPRCDDELPA